MLSQEHLEEKLDLPTPLHSILSESPIFTFTAYILMPFKLEMIHQDWNLDNAYTINWLICYNYFFFFNKIIIYQMHNEFHTNWDESLWGLWKKHCREFPQCSTAIWPIIRKFGPLLPVDKLCVYTKYHDSPFRKTGIHLHYVLCSLRSSTPSFVKFGLQ